MTETPAPLPARRLVVGLGEVLWDCFPGERRPGGAPANVAYHATQLGERGVIASRVGRDDAGGKLRARLQASGLDLGWLQVDERHPTGTVTVDTSDASAPCYTIHEDVAWDHLEATAELEELAASADAVCFGTLVQRSPRSRETVHRLLALATRALRVYDVNLRQHYYAREWIERSLQSADLVKLNLQEVSDLAALLGTGAADPRTFAVALRARYQVGIVCVTRAADGCAAFARDDEADVPGQAVVVADAVGAGDAFTAAFLSAQLDGWQLDAAARFANEVGALVASRHGAMPELRAEYAALRTRYLR